VPKHDVLKKAAIVLIVKTEDVAKFMGDGRIVAVVIYIDVADDLRPAVRIGFAFHVDQLVIIGTGGFLCVDLNGNILARTVGTARD